jgi:drug/metabolite transporter (DMT)-like permease
VELHALALGTMAGRAGQTLPMGLTYLSVRTLGSVLTAILAALELPVAVLLSAFWLKEPVAVWQWVGVAIMLAAIIFGAGDGPPKPIPG